VLVEIDPADYDVAVAKAEAELADAVASAEAQEINVPVTSISTASVIRGSEADVAGARAGTRASEKQVDLMRAGLAQAEANDVKFQADLERYRQLVEKQEVSRQQYDEALAAARASSAMTARRVPWFAAAPRSSAIVPCVRAPALPSCASLGSSSPSVRRTCSSGMLTPATAALAGSTVRGLHSMYCGIPFSWR